MAARQRAPNPFRGMSERERLAVWNAAQFGGMAGLVKGYGPTVADAIALALGMRDETPADLGPKEPLTARESARPTESLAAGSTAAACRPPDPLKGLSTGQIKRINHFAAEGRLTRIKAIVGEARGIAIGRALGLERDAPLEQGRANQFASLHRRLA